MKHKSSTAYQSKTMRKLNLPRCPHVVAISARRGLRTLLMRLLPRELTTHVHRNRSATFKLPAHPKRLVCVDTHGDLRLAYVADAKRDTKDCCHVNVERKVASE